MEEENIYPIFDRMLSRKDKEELLGQRGVMLWLTGLSGSGKSTIAIALERELHKRGLLCRILDGDNIRSGINNNLGFSAEDRVENIRRIAEIGKLFVDMGIITIAAFISPGNELRQMAARIIGIEDFLEIYVSTPLVECEKRDVKGLYAKARRGEIKNFTGISAPFEAPEHPALSLDTSKLSLEESVNTLLELVLPIVGKKGEKYIHYKMEENYKLSHLRELEAESIHIIREVAAEFENPVMLYSIGKDSSVMVRLAEKAFYPGKVPFPLMHIDSKWKFREMIEFRDQYAKEHGWNLIVESNMEAFNAGVGPFTHGSKVHTDLMKTQALLHGLDKYRFDAAFGGARRDEEKSRAKERIFSFRDRFHQWDPKNQRPELWDIYNAKIHKGESIRVFPLSNWTELDIWQYIRLENIPIVPLYFAKERPVVNIDGNLIMADDDRLPEEYRDRIEMKKVRFRTLGCWPLTGAVESDVDTIEKIVEEMMTTTKSERTTRVIDFDQDASMEQKKREGYF